MLTTNPFDDDKLKEECGIFGIWGADEAASFVALGLHALQHRGQEAAGITSYDGSAFHSHRAMGHVAGNFDRDDIIRKLAGRTAIGSASGHWSWASWARRPSSPRKASPSTSSARPSCVKSTPANWSS